MLERNWLVPYELIDRNSEQIDIKPVHLSLISHPSEWSFNALKDAALLQLDINTLALEHGMILKDASAYNVQFLGPCPIFIDTLSFDFYREGTPWYAFGQFCRHFLAPLLLMKYRSLDSNQMLNHFIDGVPLDLASRLLPWKTHFSPFIKSNIHLHAKAIEKGQRRRVPSTATLSKKSLLNILRYTRSFLSDLEYDDSSSEWGDYYSFTNYSQEAFAFKERTIAMWVDEVRARKIWDVGGNDGHFSRNVSAGKKLVLATDLDPIAVDRSFIKNKRLGEEGGFSLQVNILNPTPSFGFENREREGFLTRVKGLEIDCSFVLALIHHLCISNNCSFKMVAQLLRPLSRHIIIEFVDREDSWVERLLKNMGERRHLFDWYSKSNFEQAFGKCFAIQKRKQIPQTMRTLYLMTAK